MFFWPSLLNLPFWNNTCADRGLSEIINMRWKNNLCTWRRHEHQQDQIEKNMSSFKKILEYFINGDVQLNSCNSNSFNSKDHLNRTNYLVPSKFTRKPLQENSFNSNSHNSKNHLNRTNFSVLWTYFSSCNPNFGFGV